MSFSGYISLFRGAAPSQWMPTIFGISSKLADVINHAKFHIDKLRGFGLTEARKSYISIGEHGCHQHTS